MRRFSKIFWSIFDTRWWGNIRTLRFLRKKGSKMDPTSFNKQHALNISTPSVIGILFSLDRTACLLIQRRDVPVWVLPGGGIEPEELPTQAIIREFAEETGLTVSVQRLVGEYFPINKLAQHTLLYECTPIEGTLRTGRETRAIDFFPLNRLPRLLPPPFPEWISDALQIGPPIHRSLLSVTYTAFLKNCMHHPILTFRFICARLGYPINTFKGERSLPCKD